MNRMEARVKGKDQERKKLGALAKGSFFDDVGCTSFHGGGVWVPMATVGCLGLVVPAVLFSALDAAPLQASHPCLGSMVVVRSEGGTATGWNSAAGAGKLSGGVVGKGGGVIGPAWLRGGRVVVLGGCARARVHAKSVCTVSWNAVRNAAAAPCSARFPIPSNRFGLFISFHNGILG